MIRTTHVVTSANPVPRRGRPVPSARSEPLEMRRLLSAALLKDINPSTGDSSPGNMTDVNGTLYFSAYTPATGRELFKSDGTAAGTVLVKDIIPGDNGSAPSGLAATADGTVFFSASRPTENGSQDRELWKTDGTAEGTVLVRDISPSVVNGSTPVLLTAVGNTLYFIANDNVHGVELWKSDGTEASTVLVKDVAPGFASPMIIELIAFGGNLYFLAAAEGGAFQVWRSDGTEAGTSVFHPGPAGTDLLTAGGLLYFTANDAEHGAEVWRTDGTEVGTFPLDARPGADGAAPGNLTDAGDGTLVFAALLDAGGQELWRTDGTPEGTVRITDINGPGRPAVVVSDVSTAGDTVVFKSTNDDLYRVGATPGAEANLGHFPSTFNMNLAQSGNGDYVFFASEDAVTNTMTLHRSDGTAAGTVALRTLMGPTTIWNARPFRDGVVLVGRDPEHGIEPWVSDGTVEGTRLLADVNAAPEGSLPTSPVGSLPLSAPVELRPAAGAPLLVFVARDQTANEGVWATDGTPAGTVKLFEAAPRERVTALASAGARVLFVTEGIRQTGRLWATDGTPRGTRAVGENLRVDPFSTTFSGPRADSFTASGGFVYFSAATSDQSNDYNLWRSDGTAEGTRLIADLPDDVAFNPPRDITGVKGTVFFTAANGPNASGGNELWKTDGTEAGTVRLRSFLPDGNGGDTRARDLTAAGGTLFFVTTDPAEGEALWKSDGTEAGTVKVRSFRFFSPQPSGTDEPKVLHPAGDRVVFAADTAGPTDNNLWSSDGTAAGTVVLRDLSAVSSQAPAKFRSAGDKVFFSVLARQAGEELWVTDGTPAGTYAVEALSPVPLHADDGVLYFRQYEPGSGYELWQSDGTPAGTHIVHDVNPGGASSHPRLAATFDGKVVFWADDGTHGAEPWVAPHVPAPLPCTRVVGRHVFYNNSAFDGANPAANAADDAAIAPDKAVLFPGRPVLRLANTTSYTRGINGLMVDVVNLPAGVTLTPDDFDFGTALPPREVTVRRGAGEGGSDRITLAWTDFDPAADSPTMAVANGWLRVTVKANERTGLAAPDVFAVSNLIGEADGGFPPRVTALDLAEVRRGMTGGAATPASRADFNRDGRVNALDLAAARRYLGNVLRPSPFAAAVTATAAAQERDRVAGDVLA